MSFIGLLVYLIRSVEISYRKQTLLICLLFLGIYQPTFGALVSGDIRLPDGESSSSSVGNSVVICTFDSSLDLVDCNSKSFGIDEGETSVNYSINYEQAPLDGFYTLSSSCYTCSDYVSDDQYLQPNGGFAFSKTYVTSIPTTLDIVLDSGQSLSGIIAIPDSGIAHDYIYNRVRLCIYDNADSEIVCKQTNSVIEQGVSSIAYKIAFLPIPNGGYYKLFAQCVGTCPGFVKDPQYLQSDGSVDFRETQLGTLPSIQNFTLSRGQMLTGEVSLPSGHEVEYSVFADIELCRYDSALNLVGCDYVSNVTSSSLELTAPNFTDDYVINFLPAPDGGFYQLSVICSAHCDIYSQNRMYLQTGGTMSFEPSFLTALPDNVNFELYEAITLDAYENDDSVNSARLIGGHETQIRSIHQEGDLDWLKFRLSFPFELSLIATNLGSEGNPTMTLFDGTLTQVERHDDVIDNLEAENSRVSSIKIDKLPAGEYFIKIEGFNPTSRIRNYSFEYKGPDETICMPIKVEGSNLVVICL